MAVGTSTGRDQPVAGLRLAGVEAVVGGAVVVFDLAVPTLVLLAMAAVSLGVRREGPAALGLRRPDRPLRMAGLVLGFVAAWTVLHLAVFMPVLERATGTRQDVGQFAGLEGDVGRLAIFLALTWTIAAVGEEVAYRGYLHTRVCEALSGGPWGTVAAVVVTAVLFGLAHTEQGPVGMGLTFLDGLVFGWLRLRFATVWAPVLAHGFSNTIGLVAFYLVGPITALW